MDLVEFYAFSPLMTFPWDGGGGISEGAITHDSEIHVWYDADDDPEDVRVWLSPTTLW
jgi:hypothetical protein